MNFKIVFPDRGTTKRTMIKSLNLKDVVAHSVDEFEAMYRGEPIKISVIVGAGKWIEVFRVRSDYVYHEDQFLQDLERLRLEYFVE